MNLSLSSYESHEWTVASLCTGISFRFGIKSTPTRFSDLSFTPSLTKMNRLFEKFANSERLLPLLHNSPLTWEGSQQQGWQGSRRTLGFGCG